MQYNVKHQPKAVFKNKL